MDPVILELRAELEATRLELSRVQARLRRLEERFEYGWLRVLELMHAVSVLRSSVARLRRLEERFEYGWLRVLELMHAVSVLRSSVAAIGHHLVQHFQSLVLDLRTRF
eukprot:s797_g1.t1